MTMEYNTKWKNTENISHSIRLIHTHTTLTMHVVFLLKQAVLFGKFSLSLGEFLFELAASFVTQFRTIFINFLCAHADDFVETYSNYAFDVFGQMNFFLMLKLAIMCWFYQLIYLNCKTHIVT